MNFINEAKELVRGNQDPQQDQGGLGGMLKGFEGQQQQGGGLGGMLDNFQGQQGAQQGAGGAGGMLESFMGGGGQGQQGGGLGGLSHMLNAAEQAGAGHPDASADDQNLFQNFSQKFMKGNNPAGVGNSGDVNKLLGMFEQQTGNSFTGTGPEWNILSKIAGQVTGHDVNPFVLQKLVQWKMGNML